jgi:hypothetical protein
MIGIEQSHRGVRLRRVWPASLWSARRLRCQLF